MLAKALKQKALDALAAEGCSSMTQGPGVGSIMQGNDEPESNGKPPHVDDLSFDGQSSLVGHPGPVADVPRGDLRSGSVTDEADDLIKNPESALRGLRLNPDLTTRAGEGFRALRAGVSDFFIATDQGAERTKEVVDKVIRLIEAELDRQGLSPEERLEFLRTGERMAGQVAVNEADVRASNERILTKVVGVAAGAVVGVALLGYLTKNGKLPPLNPPAI